MRKPAQRKAPEVRNEEILKAAIAVSKKVGYTLLSVSNVAEKSNVSKPLVLYHYKTVEKLRDKVMSAAIDREILPIIAQGMVHKHRAVRGISWELQKKVLDLLSKPIGK